MIFKDYVFKAQEQPIPLCVKLSNLERRTAWMSRELLTEVKHKMGSMQKAEMGMDYCRGLTPAGS